MAISTSSCGADLQTNRCTPWAAPAYRVAASHLRWRRAISPVPSSCQYPSRSPEGWPTCQSASLSIVTWQPGTAWSERRWWWRSQTSASPGTSTRLIITKPMRMMPSPFAGCPRSLFSTTATPLNQTCGLMVWCCGRSSPMGCSHIMVWVTKRLYTMWGTVTSSPALSTVRWSCTIWWGFAGAHTHRTGPASAVYIGYWSVCIRTHSALMKLSLRLTANHRHFFPKTHLSFCKKKKKQCSDLVPLHFKWTLTLSLNIH